MELVYPSIALALKIQKIGKCMKSDFCTSIKNDFLEMEITGLYFPLGDQRGSFYCKNGNY